MNEKEKFVYGLAGIMELLHCSKTTAIKLKNTTLAPAVYQSGRKIMLNVEEALALMKAGTSRAQ